ncbi:MAG: glucose-6-phosphate isomerase, partial [Desulfobacterales bacterium]|nr:glucose-6-phosphate isomerase [Desulfobacterales bacterium]
MLKRINPIHTEAWAKLSTHYAQIKPVHMNTLFDRDPARFDNFSIAYDDILFDYSKNIITEETMSLLCDLARQTGLEDAIALLFKGAKINETENRAVLHTALRHPKEKSLVLDGKNIMPGIRQVLDQVRHFSEELRSGRLKGATGRPITDVVNIGIGGSDLGPKMVVRALRHYGKKELNVHFVSNVDGSQIHDTLSDLNPETTFFLIASKTFTTTETMTNAQTARRWLVDGLGSNNAVAHHFAALSTNVQKIADFGIRPDRTFKFWDFVGGRYSLWSAIGLPISIAVGFDKFSELLDGAHRMDRHFQSAPFAKNIPVVLALLGIWYNNFFRCETEAVLPYIQSLNLLPAYLQQLSMESNGKSVDRSGAEVTYPTGQILWGEPGTNGQHAFFQLIHQGTSLIPATFIGAASPSVEMEAHHEILMANCFSQTEALMRGKSLDQINTENSSSLAAKTVPFRVFKGNRPSNTILLRKLTPNALGSLIAMYEHKVFTQGIIWNIFSFDQWGVELGKELSKKILDEIRSDTVPSGEHDSSTTGLISAFKTMRQKFV